MCQGWGHMARECPTQHCFKSGQRELGECGSPPPATVAPANSRPLPFLPQPRQRPASMKAAWWTGLWEVAPVVPFLNPDQTAHLVGWSNEAPVIVDGQKVTALIDSGAQVSSISSGFCEHMTLKVHFLGRLLELEGTGGSPIPYLGYLEVNLLVPGIKCYNEDGLLLVILTTTYSEKVPVMVGSKIIDRAMGMMTKGELTRATATCKQAYFDVVMSGSLQQPWTDSMGNWEVGKMVTPSPGSDPTASREFCLDDVPRPVHTTWRTTIPPSGTISIHGNTGIWGHCMQVHMLAEPAWGSQFPTSMILTATYGELHLCSSQVPICLSSPNAHFIEVPAKAVGGKVTAANQVLPVALPKETTGGSNLQSPERMDPEGIKPPGPRGVAWNRTRTGQVAATQMGTPVSPQWPGPGQNIPD